MTKREDRAPISQRTLDQASQPRPVVKARTKGNPAKRNYAMSFYIPRPTVEHMQEYAHAHKTSLQQIVAEAVDKWLAEQMLPPFYPEGWFKE
jgi:hypothetical protein